jgi:hypothetical protein
MRGGSGIRRRRGTKKCAKAMHDGIMCGRRVMIGLDGSDREWFCLTAISYIDLLSINLDYRIRAKPFLRALPVDFSQFSRIEGAFCADRSIGMESSLDSQFRDDPIYLAACSLHGQESARSIRELFMERQASECTVDE